MKIFLLGIMLLTSAMADDLMIYSCHVSAKNSPDKIIANALLSNQAGDLELSVTNKLDKQKELIFKYTLEQSPDMPDNRFLLNTKVGVQLKDSDSAILMTAKKTIAELSEIEIMKYSKFLNIYGELPLISTEQLVLTCENQIRHQTCIQSGCN